MFRRLRKMNSLQRNTAAFRRCPSLRRFVKRSQLREAIRTGHFCALKRSTRSKRFRAVSEQRTRNGIKDRAKNRRRSRYTSFLGLSLPRNHTETFASEASWKAITVSEPYKYFHTQQDEKRAATLRGRMAERTRESTSEITDFIWLQSPGSGTNKLSEESSWTETIRCRYPYICQSTLR